MEGGNKVCVWRWGNKVCVCGEGNKVYVWRGVTRCVCVDVG